MRRTVPILRDISDGGAWERMLRFRLACRIDGRPSAEERLEMARQFLRGRNRSLLDVLDAIVENENDREESIRSLTRPGMRRSAAHRRYYRARSALLKLFTPNERIKTK